MVPRTAPQDQSTHRPHPMHSSPSLQHRPPTTRTRGPQLLALVAAQLVCGIVHLALQALPAGGSQGPQVEPGSRGRAGVGGQPGVRLGTAGGEGEGGGRDGESSQTRSQEPGLGAAWAGTCQYTVIRAVRSRALLQCAERQLAARLGAPHQVPRACCPKRTGRAASAGAATRARCRPHPAHGRRPPLQEGRGGQNWARQAWQQVAKRAKGQRHLVQTVQQAQRRYRGRWRMSIRKLHSTAHASSAAAATLTAAVVAAPLLQLGSAQRGRHPLNQHCVVTGCNDASVRSVHSVQLQTESGGWQMQTRLGGKAGRARESWEGACSASALPAATHSCCCLVMPIERQAHAPPPTMPYPHLRAIEDEHPHQEGQLR